MVNLITPKKNKIVKPKFDFSRMKPSKFWNENKKILKKE
jgi:hypothetical protein